MTSVDGQQARVEAAANQIDYGLGVGASVETLAKDALAAADAVMFGDEAVERVAFELYKDDWWGQPTAWPEPPFADGATLEDYKADYLKTARAVLAALKGDDK